MFDRPQTRRIFFEEVIRENRDLGRPDQVGLIFDRKIIPTTPGPFRTRVITDGVVPHLYVDDGDRLLGARVVDELLAVGGGRDQGCQRGVVEGAGDAVGKPMETHDRVVGEELVRPFGEREVVGK